MPYNKERFLTESTSTGLQLELCAEASVSNGGEGQIG